MRAWTTGALAACALAFGATAVADTPAPLSAEAIWRFQRIGDPSLSPDGRLAVASVTRYVQSENKGYTDLWLFPTDGGAPRQLTADLAGDSDARFSPDGRWIAFVSKRGEDKQGQIYVIAVDGGEARRVTDVPTGAFAPRWLPDSARVAFLSRVWPDLTAWEDQGKRLKERDESKMTARVWNSAPISYWDRWLDDRETHIYLIDRNGGTPHAVTVGSGANVDLREGNAGSYDISPDGLEIAFDAETQRGNASNYDVFVIPTAGGRARNITPTNPADDGNPRYSPDGRWLAFGQQRERGFYADRARLMLMDRRTGAVRGLTESFDRSASGIVWMNAQTLLGSIDDRATRRVYAFDVGGGAPRQVTTSSDFGGIAAGGGRIVAVRQSFSEPPTLVRLDLRTGAATQLSHFNDAALAGAAMGRVESVTYKGARGDDIQMWVVYPPDFDRSKKYPLMLLLHGGPHAGVTDAWTYRWNAQVFAGWGYVTAWHNFHGSSGFGNAFTDSINPDWATLPYEDTIKAADWFKAQPWIDSERMAAAGGSYGGYLASLILGRQHPFKTLVAHAAVYNTFTQIGSDGGAERARFYEYWENPQAFAAVSPHTNAANFNTPTLVIHGQQDLRVPVNHGIELFNTLQKRGVPSRLVYFPDENHWVLKPQNSVFWYGQVREWLATYAPPGGRAGPGTPVVAAPASSQ